MNVYYNGELTSEKEICIRPESSTKLILEFLITKEDLSSLEMVMFRCDKESYTFYCIPYHRINEISFTFSPSDDKDIYLYDKMD